MSETIVIGGLTLEFLHSRDDTAHSLDMFRMTIQPQARMPIAHYHDRWDETVYGLIGITHWTLDDREIAVGPGESLFIPRGVVHVFDNRTDTAVSCLSVLTPGVLGPAYFREIAALVGSGAPDPDKMKEVMTRHGLIAVPNSE